MANFVKSVETISLLDFSAGSASLETRETDLTKGQDETQCVPFYTLRADVGTGPDTGRGVVSLEMYDNAGTPAVRAKSYVPSAANSTKVSVTVVEFESSVTIQSGSTTFTSTVDSLLTETITTVTDVDNAFVVLSQHFPTGSNTGSLGRMYFKVDFNSVTEIEIKRSSSSGDWVVLWYVVEGNGSDFLTEYVEDTATSAETGDSVTLSNTIDLTKAFTIPTFLTSETGLNLFDGVCNQALTGTTTWQWYRDSGTGANATLDIGAWVVRAGGSEFSVQRAAIDLTASLTTDHTITAVDDDISLVLPNSNTGSPSNMPAGLNGQPVYAHTHILDSATNVSLDRLQTTGFSFKARFEVIDFTGEAGGAVGDGLISGLKLQRPRLAA